MHVIKATQKIRPIRMSKTVGTVGTVGTTMLNSLFSKGLLCSHYLSLSYGIVGTVGTDEASNKLATSTQKQRLTAPRIRLFSDARCFPPST